jgi:glycine/D-amino acid oxidase-like deaminating enzyme/nitrite reductase/ring-hydroxylating ferredoxin subunit
MKSNGPGTTACWMEFQAPEFQALATDTEADVCIVGAGIAGLTTAYLLQQCGRAVVVLDEGCIGAGESGRTTAHLSNALDDRYYELERLHGEQGARIAAQSHTAAIAMIESLVNELQIDCDFARVDGYLFAANERSDDILLKELAAAERAGLKDVRWAREMPSAFANGPGLLFPGQAVFHPLKYLAGLAQAFVQLGGRLYSNTHVSAITTGEPAQVETGSGHKVTAASLVIATNVPINDRFVMHTKQAPYRSYVIAIEVPAGSVVNALYWDTADPYHYVRVAAHDDERDLLIVGGEDHKTGQANDGAERFARLEQWTRERFAGAGNVLYRWSGQVMEPVDGVAFIGRNPRDNPNVYIATGDSGNGITHGTIAGMLIRDLVAGRDNPWAELYAPGRKSVSSLRRFAGENLNVAAQYAQWLAPAECHSIDEIPPECGRIMRERASRIAVFRDAQGNVHRSNAKCPHLGCVVVWNDTEKSWDCPCHGSRFAGDGTVIAGPSKADLERLPAQQPPR